MKCMPRAKKIEKERWYTLKDLVVNEVFPWANSFWSIRRIVSKDQENQNVLKVTITGEGRGRKYHFKGEHIISFIKAVDAGKIKL